MVKPNAIIVGFPRCGTTYLYGLLKQHPEISVSDKKEINFFNVKPYFLANPEIPSPRIFKSSEWYLNHFKKNKVIIDFAMMSSYDVHAIYRVKHLLGDVKIIFIKREKESHKKSIKNLVKAHNGKEKNIEKYSDFEQYIQPYKKIFSNVYTTSLEEIKNKQGIEKLLKFLGVKSYPLNQNVSKNTIDETRKEFTFFNFIKRNLYYFIAHIIKNFI